MNWMLQNSYFLLNQKNFGKMNFREPKKPNNKPHKQLKEINAEK